MKREVMFVCDCCSTGYACEPDAVDCEKVCKLKEMLTENGFIELSEAVDELNTFGANRLVKLLEKTW